MTFNEYLHCINKLFMNGKNYEEFMYEFFTLITSETKSNPDKSSPFESDSFLDKAKNIYYGQRTFPKKDAEYIKKHFNKKAFDSFIKDSLSKMPKHVQINVIKELQEFDGRINEKNISNKLSEKFLKYIDEIINKERKKRVTKDTFSVTNAPSISNDSASETVENNIKTNSFDEQTLTVARNFCIDHEEEKELIPLCQIGFNLNPLHKHFREMYTEYNRLNTSEQKAIMALNDIPYYKFEDDWEYIYLNLFREDIAKLKLINESDLLHDAGKYFHHAFRYADTILTESNPRVFPAVPHPFIFDRDKSDLINYIDEYLFYQGNDEAMEIVGEPPFEWMIYHMDLRGCPDDQLAYYMCLFIYSACHVIPREYGRKKPEEILFTAPNFEDIKTMEDFYYAALMSLYNIYSETT